MIDDVMKFLALTRTMIDTVWYDEVLKLANELGVHYALCLCKAPKCIFTL